MAVRRVRRVVRKIDPWTVLRVSLIFNAIAALVFVLGTWIMWSLLVQRGIPDQIAELTARLTIPFEPNGELYFRVVVLLAIVGAVAMTGIMTMAAVFYNLISDLVGGIEVVVLEETMLPQAAQSAPTAVRPARNPVFRRRPKQEAPAAPPPQRPPQQQPQPAPGRAAAEVGSTATRR